MSFDYKQKHVELSQKIYNGNPCVCKTVSKGWMPMDFGMTEIEIRTFCHQIPGDMVKVTEDHQILKT